MGESAAGAQRGFRAALGRAMHRRRLFRTGIALECLYSGNVRNAASEPASDASRLEQLGFRFSQRDLNSGVASILAGPSASKQILRSDC